MAPDTFSEMKLGFIGLGQMGGAMALNLLRAGYPITVYDLEPEKVQALVAEGAFGAQNARDVVLHSDVVLTSLPYSDTFVTVAEEELLPSARRGQVFVDLGTVAPLETQRLARAFAEAGATLLDVPVSGGHRGAVEGSLRMFAGGDRAAYERLRPLLEVLGDPEHIAYCGESGLGQVVKGVNQLSMGLASAAYLEAVAFGLLAGVDPEAIAVGVGGEGGWRQRVRDIAHQIAAGEGEEIGVKFGQLHDFLEAAEHFGFELPLARALYDFCKEGEYCVVEVNRPSPSFWRELCLQAETDEEES